MKIPWRKSIIPQNKLMPLTCQYATFAKTNRRFISNVVSVVGQNLSECHRKNFAMPFQNPIHETHGLAKIHFLSARFADYYTTNVRKHSEKA